MTGACQQGGRITTKVSGYLYNLATLLRISGPMLTWWSKAPSLTSQYGVDFGGEVSYAYLAITGS
jgi:hypothetical protein